jgi:cell division cycle 2-like
MKKRGKWDSSSEDEGESSRLTSKVKKVAKEIQPAQSLPIVSDSTKITNEKESVVKINQLLNIADNSNSESDRADTPESIPDTIPPKSLKRPHDPLFDGCRSVEEYIRLNFISQGTYGVVFRAKCRTSGKIYALKQVKLGPETEKVGFMLTALREINILLSLKHPNIVKVREMVVGSSLDKIYMVMEYADNDLKYCIDQSSHPFSTAEIKRLTMQLLSAVDHMHTNWIIHRDLKPSNILYSNSGKLLLADFGMARKYDRPIQPYTREVVTLWYRCPELLLGAPTYSTALDIWSVGCIVAEMISTKPLFPGEGEIDQINKIFSVIGAPTVERWPSFTTLPYATRISSRISTR